MIEFIVEDGSGLPDSTAYSSVEDVNQYLENTGASDDWTLASESKKQQAINEATNYIDNVYGIKIRGTLANEDQALCWPREDAISTKRGCLPNDVVPADVKKATAILAQRTFEGNLYEINELGNVYQEDLPLKSIDQSVGPVKEAKSFAIKDINNNLTDTTQHKDVYNLMKQYMRTGKYLVRG